MRKKKEGRPLRPVDIMKELRENRKKERKKHEGTHRPVDTEKEKRIVRKID